MLTPTDIAQISEEAIDLYEMYQTQGMSPESARWKAVMDLMTAAMARDEKAIDQVVGFRIPMPRGDRRG